MSERTTTTTDHHESHQRSSCCCCLSSLTTTVLFSSKIFLTNPQIFLSIFALITFPLSLLLVSLSLSSHPLQSQIYYLESLAVYSSTTFEARQIWKESRDNARSLLLRTKALYVIPCYFLSLFAVITAVDSAALACRNKRPSFHTAVQAVKDTWERALITSLFVYAIALAYAAIPRTVAAIVVSLGPRLFVEVVAAVFEVYLMAALSLGLVVSVTEERFGLDAIRVGSELMRARWFSGWVLSGLVVLMSCGIGWQLEGLMDGQHLFGRSYTSVNSTVMMAIMSNGDKVSLVCLLGLVVLWSYVVTTVFYFECRKYSPIKCDNEIVCTV